MNYNYELDLKISCSLKGIIDRICHCSRRYETSGTIQRRPCNSGRTFGLQNMKNVSVHSSKST